MKRAFVAGWSCWVLALKFGKTEGSARTDVVPVSTTKQGHIKKYFVGIHIDGENAGRSPLQQPTIG
jgi:hypothetical protein